MQDSAVVDLQHPSAAPSVGQADAGAAAAAAAAVAQPVSELEADAMRQAAAGLLLPFQRSMVEELLEEDGLCVMSPGLGLHQVQRAQTLLPCCFLRAVPCRTSSRPTTAPQQQRQQQCCQECYVLYGAALPLQVVAVLLRLQDVRLRQPGQRGVVLVLGASSWQRDALRRELQRIDPAIQKRASAALGGGGGARAAGARGNGSLRCLSLTAPSAWHHLNHHVPVRLLPHPSHGWPGNKIHPPALQPRLPPFPLQARSRCLPR